MDMLWYGHKYGFVPEAEFDFLWNNCTTRSPSAHTLGKFGAKVDKVGGCVPSALRKQQY